MEFLKVIFKTQLSCLEGSRFVLHLQIYCATVNDKLLSPEQREAFPAMQKCTLFTQLEVYRKKKKSVPFFANSLILKVKRAKIPPCPLVEANTK